MKTKEFVQIAVLAAVAIVLQIANPVIGFKTPFGMTIDLVGVPIILALFMFGFEASLYVATIVALIIMLTDYTNWIGASTKFAATMALPVVAAFLVFARRQNVIGRGVGVMLVPGAIAILLVLVVGNAYMAAENAGIGSTLILGLLPVLLPFLVLLIFAEIWRLGSKEMQNFRLLMDWRIFAVVLVISLLVRGLSMTMANYYYAIPLFYNLTPQQAMELFPWWMLVGWNAVQSIIEASVAWVLAYKYMLVKYAK